MHQVSILYSGALFREALRRILEGTEFYIPDEVAAWSSEERGNGVDERGAEGNGASRVVIVDLLGEDEAERACEAIRDLRRDLPGTKIVVLTESSSAELFAKVVQQGADAYLLKEISGDVFRRCLELVVLGQRIFPTCMTAKAINGPPSDATHVASRFDTDVALSDRETQILHCLVNGCSNKAIARELDIAEATVKVHVKGLLRKIHATNRTQAAVWALSHESGGGPQRAQRRPEGLGSDGHEQS